jgi:WD40 repeat protein
MSRRALVVLLTPVLLLAAARLVGGGPERPPAPAAPPATAGTDPLPPAALVRLGSLRLFHGGTVQALAFLDDGTLLSLGEERLHAWESATGREVPVPVALPCPTTAFTLSANRRMLAAAGNDRVLRVFDLRSRRLLRHWPLGSNPGNGLAFSPEGNVVAWSDNSYHIHLRDLGNDRDVRVLKGHSHTVADVAFSPDGKSLSSVSYRDGAFTWDLGTGKRMRRYQVPEDRQYLYYDAGTHFSHDGATLVAAGSEGNILGYETGSVEERFRIAPAQGRVYALRMAPGGRTFVSGGSDGSVREWQTATGKATRVLAPAIGSSVNALAYSPDGKVLALGRTDGTIQLRDAGTGKELLAHEPVEPFALASFSSDGNEVITLQPSRLLARSARTGKELRRIKLTGGAIVGATLSSDRTTLAVARDDKPLCLLDAVKGGERAVTGVTFRRDTSLVFTPDGARLAGVGAEEPGTVRLFQSDTGKEVTTFKTDSPDRTSFALAMSRDGRTLFGVGQEPGALLRWEMATGKRRGAFTLPNPVVGRAGFGEIFIMGGRWHHQQATRLVMALSPDGRLLALSRGQMVLLCDLRREKVLHCLLAGKESMAALAFSGDGRMLAGGGEDRHVCLWDVRTGAQLASLAGHRGRVQHVELSPKSDRLLSSSLDGTVLVWDVEQALRLPAAAAPSARRALAGLWADLASDDAGVAEKAQRELEERPAEAVALLKQHLSPVKAVPAARLAQLVTELDSDTSQARDRASEQLGQLDELALPALRKAVSSASAEVRRRAQNLLDRIERPSLSGEQARPVRAVEVLEAIAGPEARKLLAEVADGTPGARLTREARASLERLGGKRVEEGR